MSNKIKMRNVGAQTQKKWRPVGPPLEGRGPGGVGARRGEGWGPDPEKVRAPRVGVGRVGPEGWGPAAWGLEGGPPKISRFFFSLSRLHFRSFSFSLGSCRGILVVFEKPGPSNVHV